MENYMTYAAAYLNRVTHCKCWTVSSSPLPGILILASSSPETDNEAENTALSKSE